MENPNEATLFVDADEDHMESETDHIISQISDDVSSEAGSDSGSDFSSDPLDADPVVQSIPLFMNTAPAAGQSLHLLQYTGKSKRSPAPLHHLRASIKPESNFLQVTLPLDTSKFYDDSKAEEWGVQVEEHDHTGVMNQTNGGIYAAKFVVEDGHRKVVLVPVVSSVQLRPSFKYLDEAENVKLQQKRDMAEPPRAGPQNVHILQSSSKTNKSIPSDPLANASLGESLRHVRRFDQEDWKPVRWTEATPELSKQIINTSDSQFITDTKLAQYLDQLTH
ncbi:hypothetical protein PSN45_001531 [Yamadazyma tenuis]|uniref:Uncharacterized protein n=1 Tax=Candida tenuis (strain ATCC 10573 / BCRC 21748 / CBS 615 / JCM 9827 / NBRC 10315 / NRRL Y-1498 / VKM Y-70) TaxID=590646 RepID=G3BFH5_CANTC|nr:uncharacterized protein CANTEDRAFT_116750 [Yamadazyma tenuis ATCC 10573]EGV60694.1 hypothetical protein CANTEDRAFT_116750 [Yamadazyma tenuis ATCC 10573]WEJ94053.1 hypothetical protein PSN45_001531 [Yamadazyma tenuis]